MILSGRRIYEEIQAGNIVIDPFDEKRLNPNSYNVRLADELLMYENGMLDMAKEPSYEIVNIPKAGKMLVPGRVYLARTMERTTTNGFVPMIEGRSSVGRLGLFIHSTAGFGDNGFDGYWTLELSCVQPIWIYPEIEIAQVYFHTILGADDYLASGISIPEDIPSVYRSGKYQGNNGIQPSKLWTELQK